MSNEVMTRNSEWMNHIVNPALNGNTIAEISMMTHRKFIISRVWRGFRQVVTFMVSTSSTVLREV